MKRRSKWAGAGAGVLGVMLALGSSTAASAAQDQTMGSAPKSAMCKEVKNDWRASSIHGLAIERAATSRKFASTKQAMLKALSGDINNFKKTLAVVKTAPPKVQAAFKNLLSTLQQARTATQNATTEHGLSVSFPPQGKGTHLYNDNITIFDWYRSACGGNFSVS
jgi:hypothetical protein